VVRGGEEWQAKKRVKEISGLESVSEQRPAGG
jgi:hypothetical protein